VLLFAWVEMFASKNNARAIGIMEAHGMKPMPVLKSATSVNADAFAHSDQTGKIKKIFLKILL